MNSKSIFLTGNARQVFATTSELSVSLQRYAMVAIFAKKNVLKMPLSDQLNYRTLSLNRNVQDAEFVLTAANSMLFILNKPGNAI
jgi:hypothetical protein